MKYLKPFVVLVCWITLSHSVSAEIDWKAASVHFIDDTVVPAYGQFIEASQGLMDASDEYCQAEAPIQLNDFSQKAVGLVDFNQKTQLHKTIDE